MKPLTEEQVKREDLLKISMDRLTYWAWFYVHEQKKVPEDGIIFCASFKDKERSLKFREMVMPDLNLEIFEEELSKGYSPVMNGAADRDFICILETFFDDTESTIQEIREMKAAPECMLTMVINDGGVSCYSVLHCKKPSWISGESHVN